MAFRTIDISNPAELHVEKHQLVIKQEAGIVRIPLEDILHITCLGPNIRISTLALSKLSESGITVMCLDEKYYASSIVLPVKGYSRQSMIIHKQIEFMESIRETLLWKEIIKTKIENQREVLRILGNRNVEGLDPLLNTLCWKNIDECEAVAAKKYFQAISPGLNRREDTPLNSKLNYGYAVLRNSIIRSLINKGFQPAIGIHHSNQLNAFNLADDLIEPFRPMVDLAALSINEDNVVLSRETRRSLAGVLHSYCEINGKKEKIITAIDYVVERLRVCICTPSTSESLENEMCFPKVLPIELAIKVEK